MPDFSGLGYLIYFGMVFVLILCICVPGLAAAGIWWLIAPRFALETSPLWVGCGVSGFLALFTVYKLIEPGFKCRK